MNQKKIVLEFFEEVYNKHNAAFAFECFADHYHEHQPSGARSNKDAYDIICAAFKVFPDISVVMNDVICEGDIVAVRVTMTATHVGLFAGLAPTNNHISWEAMEFFKVSHNKITESWGAWPAYDMLKQLQT